MKSGPSRSATKPMLLTFTILLGALSGYAIRRLGSGRPLGRREARLLPALAWVLMALWFALAAALLVWVMLRFGGAV